MAKLFYTLEETAEKLGKDEAAITELVSQGKLREFRDHDNKLMFKVQDVDLLSGDSAGSMELDLSENLTSVGDSDTFELDLDDGTNEPKASSGRSASPVGLGAVGGEDLALDLDLDDAPAAKSAAAKSASGSAMSEPPIEDTFALDLGDTGATAPAAASKGASASMSAMPVESAPSDELTLELDLGDEPAPAAAPSRGGAKEKPLEDSLGSMAAGSAAGDDLALEGSNIGGSPEGSSISDRIGVEGGSSGSGLMDLTNESESSSIGAALMDEAFSSDEQSELPANASGIFGGEGGGESGADLAAVGAGAAVGAAAAAVACAKGKASTPIFTSGPAAPEAYSGAWSGLGVGMLLPASLGIGAAMAMVAAKMLGAPADLAVMYAKDWVMYTGALAGAILVCGGVGFFVGKATE